MVRVCPVDISPATISHFLYGPTMGHSWSPNTLEFDYRWDIARSGTFQRNAEQRETVILWLARYIAADGERAEWVAAPRLGIWDSGVPIWHCDKLVHPTGALDISLIRDVPNVAAPRREPQIEVPPLGSDLADTADLASLRTDVDALLAAPSVETQVAPTALADDTVPEALFSGTTEEGPVPTHAKGKWHRCHLTEEEKAQKRQRRQEKEGRRVSIIDEELRQQRVRERAAVASSSALVVKFQPILRDLVSITDGADRLIESTTEGARIFEVGTTEGAPTDVPAGSGKPDPCLLMIRRRFAPQVCFTQIHFLYCFCMHCGQLHLFCGLGVNGL
uniref:Integrase core domain containing protein n=1 Tax=Solanum tuberosum TaxID=4113 RepID=M1D860_SOLTU